MTLTHGSLFTGIGGIDLGLEACGIDTLWQVERDEFCLSVLNKHWPDVPKYTDVTTIDWSTVDRPDVISGGFPCQPFSSATRGRSQGTADDRWLWPHFREAVAQLRPDYVIVENVVGLRRRDVGALHVVLGDLARLGFDAWWAGLRASDAGAPHRRERVFVVAYPHRDGEPTLPVDAQARKLPSVAGPVLDWRLPTAEALRGDDGFPGRLDRRRVSALGNSVCPQVAQMVGEALKALELHADK